MTNPRLFACAECGGDVRMAAGPGRTFDEQPGVVLSIPASFQVPTCDRCGETYFSVEVLRRLKSAVAKEQHAAHAEHCRKIVQYLKNEHGVSQKDIVRACQVTPSYLSSVLTGRRLPSVMLVRLLEAFCACPSELHRHLRGEPWSSLKTMAKVLTKRRYIRDGNLIRPEWKAADRDVGGPTPRDGDGVAA